MWFFAIMIAVEISRRSSVTSQNALMLRDSVWCKTHRVGPSSDAEASEWWYSSRDNQPNTTVMKTLNLTYIKRLRPGSLNHDSFDIIKGLLSSR